MMRVTEWMCSLISEGHWITWFMQWKGRAFAQNRNHYSSLIEMEDDTAHTAKPLQLCSEANSRCESHLDQLLAGQEFQEISNYVRMFLF